MPQQSASLIGDIDIPDSLSESDVQQINALMSKGDAMSPEDVQRINATLTKAYKTDNPKAKQPPVTSWVDTAVSFLPAAGALAGGAALAVGGPVGAALGAGIGGTAGRMAERGIQEMRGTAEPVGVMNAVDDAAAGGVKDALIGGLGTAALRGVKSGVSAAGPALSAAARGLNAASENTAVKGLSKAAGVLSGLFGPSLPAAAAIYKAPKIAGVAAKGLEMAGGALERRAAAKAVEVAAPSVAARVAQIPLRERLAQIPLQDVGEAWQAAKAVAPAASTLADDVQMVRALKAIDYSQEAAIKIVAGKDKELAQLIKQGYLQTLKQRGAPIPAAALKTSGKVPPDVSALMETPTFKALADALANRQP